MLANKFIDLLEAEKLLDPEMIEELRRQVSQSGNRLPVETLAKLLVDNEQLTKFQATRLVSQVKGNTSASATPATVQPIEDDLTIATVEEDDSASETEPPKVTAIVDDSADSVEIIDDVVTPVIPISSNQGAATTLKRPVRISTSAEVEKPSRWETFRTIGAFGILLSVLAAFVFLAMWFMRGSAEEQLAEAKQAYENRDYAAAVKKYESFISSHATHKEVSFARSRIAVAKIRNATENSGDPFEGTKVAQEVLPMLMKESGLGPVLPDLAGALVNIGDKLVAKAEASKSTEERKTYVDGLVEQLKIIQDPQYIASQERRQNEPKINALEEAKLRLMRDIQRSEDRAKAVVDMKSALEKSDAVAAYKVRQVLVRQYPQLQTDKELSDLLLNATSIVQGAVKSASTQPESIDLTAQPADVGKRVLLSSNSGNTVSLAESRTLFIRAKSGLYGVDGATGKVKWRRFVEGRDLSEPVYVSDTAVAADATADCILTESVIGRLTRFAANTGEPIWSLNFGAPVLAPQLDRDLLYVTDRSGRLSCIDTESGAIRWSQQLPQPVTAGSSAGNLKQATFVVGDNANLYSMSKRDGKCNSVFYMGHESNTVVVPPVAVLGRLLVFENVGPGYSQIRVFAISDDESSVNASQDPIRLQGHVVVSPQVEGRRVVVVTNLGEISVFEVETANGKSELVKMATLVASEQRPKTSWPLLVSNDLWVTATQITKYQVQASRQQLIREWVRDDEDVFLGRPVDMGDAVVHVRNVRGTHGVRITSINKATGDPIWETNVGVPVVGVVKSGSAFHAITSQAALYTIDSNSLKAGRVDGATANPGRNQSQLMFDRVAIHENGSIAAVNSQRGSQTAYYDPKATDDKKLQVVRTQGDDAKPSGDPIWIEDGIVIPLDNGQLLAVNPATGATIGSPLQPTLEPGQKVSWSTATLLPDNKTVVAANSEKQLVRIATGKQFSKINEVAMANQASGRLATLSTKVLVPSFGQQSSFVEVYNADDLARENTVAIEGRILWGLHALNDIAICYGNTEGLIAIGPDGTRLWTSALPKAVPVGKPQMFDNQMLIASATGEIYKVNPQDGVIAGVVRTGEPISGEPLIVGTNILVPGDEGSALVLSNPQFEEYSTTPAN